MVLLRLHVNCSYTFSLIRIVKVNFGIELKLIIIQMHFASNAVQQRSSFILKLNRITICFIFWFNSNIINHYFLQSSISVFRIFNLKIVPISIFPMNWKTFDTTYSETFFFSFFFFSYLAHVCLSHGSSSNFWAG